MDGTPQSFCYVAVFRSDFAVNVKLLIFLTLRLTCKFIPPPWYKGGGGGGGVGGWNTFPEFL